MSEQPLQSVSTDELANLAAFLSKGGTLAKLNNISPDAMEATYTMAYHHYQSGNYEEAVKTFQYLCFYDQWNPRYFLSLGACQQMLRLYGQAIKTYYYAAKLDHANPIPLVYMGNCYKALQQFDKATRVYEAAVELADSNSVQHHDIETIRKKLRAIKNSPEEKSNA